MIINFGGITKGPYKCNYIFCHVLFKSKLLQVLAYLSRSMPASVFYCSIKKKKDFTIRKQFHTE